METSPFNDIPAELRNRIYEFVLTKPERTIHLDLHSLSQSDPSAARDERDTPNNHNHTTNNSFLALTSTCRQLRSECMAIYLQNHDFTLLTQNPRFPCHRSHQTLPGRSGTPDDAAAATDRSRLRRHTATIASRVGHLFHAYCAHPARIRLTLDFLWWKLPPGHDSAVRDLAAALADFRASFAAVGLRPVLWARTESATTDAEDEDKSWAADFNRMGREEIRGSLDQFWRVCQEPHERLASRFAAPSLKEALDEEVRGFTCSMKRVVEVLDEDEKWDWCNDRER